MDDVDKVLLPWRQLCGIKSETFKRRKTVHVKSQNSLLFAGLDCIHAHLWFPLYTDQGAGLTYQLQCHSLSPFEVFMLVSDLGVLTLAADFDVGTLVFDILWLFTDAWTLVFGVWLLLTLVFDVLCFLTLMLWLWCLMFCAYWLWCSDFSVWCFDFVHWLRCVNFWVRLWRSAFKTLNLVFWLWSLTFAVLPWC